MTQNSSGMLVSFEGTEGSGKSTLIRHLQPLLQDAGYSVIATREPGGSPLAEKIRNLLLGDEMSPWTELFLYQAGRAEHTAKTLKPALLRGEIVLCDRFTDSTLAYQAQARGLPWEQVKALNLLATSGIQPDLTVFLDIDPALGLSRAKDPNRFEAEDLNFHKAVHSGFVRSRSENQKRWITLKNECSTPAELAQAVLREITSRFKKQNG